MEREKHKTRRLYIALVIVALLSIPGAIIFLGWFKSRSVDQQMAEFEAAMAIPDSQNAAILYRQFIETFSVPPSIFD